MAAVIYVFYWLLRPAVKATVKKALGSERDDQEERLQEEFSQVGIKVDGMSAQNENMEKENKIKEAIKKRYDRCKKNQLCRRMHFL